VAKKQALFSQLGVAQTNSLIKLTKDPIFCKKTRILTSLIGSHKRILDLGCGNGWLAAESFARPEYANTVVGVDHDEKVVEQARSVYSRIHISDIEDAISFDWIGGGAI